MARKLSLDVDALAVESFETDGGAHEARGTVEANAVPCTCAKTCACPSALYYCGTIAFTAYSCDYTFNDSCDWPDPTQHTCVDA
jgi:hypothetical protein